MQPSAKTKALEGLRRIEGLTKKLRTLIEADAYCPKVLELSLALQGQLKHLHGTVLESHLHTCAEKKLASREKNAFIAELIKIIGLSTR